MSRPEKLLAYSTNALLTYPASSSASVSGGPASAWGWASGDSASLPFCFPSRLKKSRIATSRLYFNAHSVSESSRAFNCVSVYGDRRSSVAAIVSAVSLSTLRSRRIAFAVRVP